MRKRFLFLLLIGIFIFLAITFLMRYQRGKKYDKTALEHGYLEISSYKEQYQSWANVIDTISCVDCKRYSIRANAHKIIDMFMRYANDSIGVNEPNHFSFAQDFIKFSDEHGLYGATKYIDERKFIFKFERRFDEQFVSLIYFKQGVKNSLNQYDNYPIIKDLKKDSLGNKGLYVFDENWIVLIDNEQ